MFKKQAIVVGITAMLITAVTVFSFAKEAKNTKQGKTIKAKAGEEFIITLKSNITTGYQWQLTKAVDKGFLRLTGLRYVTKKTDLVGAGGKEEWTFKAVKPGTAIISFQYVQPWEKKAAPAKVKNFIVIIK